MKKQKSPNLVLTIIELVCFLVHYKYMVPSKLDILDILKLQ